MPDKVRVDKWLWSVRIFKTRTKASAAVKAGQVKINGKPVKASYQVQRGEELTVGKNGFNFQFKIIDLIEKRVGAPLAQKCYEDLTPAEELSKYTDWFIGKRGVEVREKGTGRPTKKDRRELQDFKVGRFFDWEDEDW
jgi:ribosome-associated heat shock protein Hsp15